jgi:hypothetical protein
MGLQVEHVGVGQDGRERFDDLGAVFGVDSGIHVHCDSPVVSAVLVKNTTLLTRQQLSTGADFL